MSKHQRQKLEKVVIILLFTLENSGCTAFIKKKKKGFDFRMLNVENEGKQAS